MPPRIADTAVWRFADALIWNWLVAGTDAHAKNYSLLLANNQVRLAPLYDISSALPYGTHEKKLRLAMKIGGDYRVFPWHNTWSGAAKDLGVDAEQLQNRVVELARMVPGAFAEAAATEEVKSLDRPLPARLVPLIAERSRRCLGLFGASNVSA
jgi:serine/threonine-protein kinase HipA